MAGELSEIQALKINQWLDEWDNVKFDDKEKRSRPEPYFYFFSIKAKDLRKLSNIYRRRADKPRKLDLAIQRGHAKERSIEISFYIKGGYPWSVLTRRQRESSENDKLKMPGWLPTSIIANILAPNTIIGDKRLKEEDSIKIITEDNSVKIKLPSGFRFETWEPDVYPITIIDGQHRLLAFDYLDDLDEDFEFPVISFYNLDITWQAYLFYTINIKPKKIKPSLAYDLFPILRTQEWLEKSPDGLMIYRETRAQELTEVLWAYPNSVWYRRINMLDEPGEGAVTQAAFIRSLIASFIKSSDVGENKIGGLFGAEINQNEVINWDRLEQGAFLIYCWGELANATKNCKEPWALAIRDVEPLASSLDPAFKSKFSLLATDQGVRVYQNIINDLCFVAANDLKLNDIEFLQTEKKEDEEKTEEALDIDYLTDALKTFSNYKPITNIIQSLCKQLVKFEWRTSSAPGLSDDARVNQMAFRGSGGYKELRKQLLKMLSTSEDKKLGDLAGIVLKRLGYDK